MGYMEFFDAKFIVAAATILFFVALFKPMKKALLGMLDERINKIAKELEDAQNLKNEAKKLFDEAKLRLEQSELEAKNIVDHASKEAETMIVKTKTKLDKDIEVRKALAVQKIRSFEENAINEIKRQISNITIMTSSQILSDVNETNFKNSVHSSIEKLSKTLH